MKTFVVLFLCLVNVCGAVELEPLPDQRVPMMLAKKGVKAELLSPFFTEFVRRERVYAKGLEDVRNFATACKARVSLRERRVCTEQVRTKGNAVCDSLQHLIGQGGKIENLLRSIAFDVKRRQSLTEDDRRAWKEYLTISRDRLGAYDRGELKEIYFAVFGPSKLYWGLIETSGL